jgi:hypothetical protein
VNQVPLERETEVVPFPVNISESFKNSGCGGVLIAESGIIEYKLNDSVLDKENCVWTISLPKKRTIKVQLLLDGFGYGQSVSVLAAGGWGELHYRDIIHQGDRNPHVIEASGLFHIAFVSEWIQFPQTGFSLSFEGVGPDRDYPRTDKIFAQTGSSGIVTYPEVGSIGGRNEFVSLVVHPELGKTVALTVEYLQIPQSRNCRIPLNGVFVDEFSGVGGINGIPDLSPRFRECRISDHSTTIYSDIPLIVSSWHTLQATNFTQISWKMV